MIRTKKTCTLCKRDISLSNYKKHCNVCKGVVKKKIRGVDFDPNVGFINGTREQWNKGRTKETCNIVKRIGEKQKGKVGPFLGRKHSFETRQIISEKRSVNNKGGRCKWFEVSGVKVQGTWERNVADKLNSMSICWIKPTTLRHSFSYFKDGIKRTYTPDFYLPEYGVYLEIKGRWWGDDKKKMEIVIQDNPDARIIIVEYEDYKRFLGGEILW